MSSNCSVFKSNSLFDHLTFFFSFKLRIELIFMRNKQKHFKKRLNKEIYAGSSTLLLSLFLCVYVCVCVFVYVQNNNKQTNRKRIYQSINLLVKTKLKFFNLTNSKCKCERILCSGRTLVCFIVD